MLELAEPIDEVYKKSLEEVGPDDPYSGPGFLGIRDVLKAHFLIADYFYVQGSGLGGIGPKSMDLLHSAMFRQHISFGGKPKWPSKYDVCATLFYGLIKDHPFHDANKRTAFLSLIYHLETLGLCPTIDQQELEDFAVDVADNNLIKFNRYKEMERRIRVEADAHVAYISYYLKNNTRRIDKKFYIITYRELKSILNRFGYDLQNPRGNTIDLVRVEDRRKIFGIWGEKEQVGVKVAQVGFPSWTTQVGRGAIKTVRSAANLTAKKGVDSQTFFKDADPISILISRYQEQLRHLADR